VQPKLIEHPNGYKEWWLNGELHREDGPAVEHPDGTKEWCLNGKRHREDGPAIEYSNGYKEGYLNGKKFTPTVLQVAKWEWKRDKTMYASNIEKD